MKYFSLFSILFCTSLTAQQTDYDRSWMAYTSGRYEEALTGINQCITNDTANYQYLFLKGKALENLYRYDEAIAVQQKALRLNPGSTEALSALATLYLLSGQPVTSAQLYEQLAANEPLVNRWKMNWATALQTAGKYRDALELWQTVVQTDSTNWWVYKNMGDCHYRIDSLIYAVDCYRKSLSIYPYNKNLYGQLTRILVLLGQDVEAITIGNKAVTIDSTNVEAWKNMGVAWYRMGIADSSLFHLNKTLALGDTSLTTSRHYGLLTHHLASYHEAEKYLFRALTADSSNINTIMYLASTYGYTGKAEKGLEVLDKLDKMVAVFDSASMRANIQRGYLLRILNRYNDAAKAFTSVTKNFPENLRYYYEVAVCYDMAFKKKQALEWYLRFLEKTDPKWATRKWTENDFKKFEFVDIAMDRVVSLKTDLFFEEEKKK